MALFVSVPQDIPHTLDGLNSGPSLYLGLHPEFCSKTCDAVLGLSGCAKGAAKGSCGETVVKKGVFGESVSSLLP